MALQQKQEVASVDARKQSRAEHQVEDALAHGSCCAHGCVNDHGDACDDHVGVQETVNVDVARRTDALSGCDVVKLNACRSCGLGSGDQQTDCVGGGHESEHESVGQMMESGVGVDGALTPRASDEETLTSTEIDAYAHQSSAVPVGDFVRNRTLPPRRRRRWMKDG